MRRTVRSVSQRPRGDSVAAEDRSAYQATTDAATDTGSAGVDVAALVAADPVSMLDQVVAAVQARRLDELDEQELRSELGEVERACRQLGARQARLVAAISRRARARARGAAKEARRSPDAAENQADRELRRQLAGELGWSPGQTKRQVQLGGQLTPNEPAGQAFDTGRLSPRHANVLADTLQWIDDEPVRAEVQARLLELAERQEPVEFGRSARRLLAETDPVAAEQAAERRHTRRSASVFTTEDGMVGISGRLAGAGGELVATAFHAFRRPNASDERRSREQAGADALVAMARAALDAGVAPRSHGVRPHVTVLLDWQTIAADAGVAETRWSGPLTTREIRELLADCSVSRLLLDPDGVPIEAGQATRNIPAGLYRIVAARDGGCIADGCDMQPVWCQLMHLDVPFRHGGRLTPETAGLGCPEHHDALDHRGWVITWIDHRPVLHHPSRPPAGPQDRRGHDGDRAAADGRPRDAGRVRPVEPALLDPALLDPALLDPPADGAGSADPTDGPTGPGPTTTRGP